MKYLSLRKQLRREMVKNQSVKSQVVSELGEANKEGYDTEVNRLIRQKYSLSNELSLLRQKDEKPLEWQEYFDYAQSCKAKAKTKEI